MCFEMKVRTTIIITLNWSHLKETSTRYVRHNLRKIINDKKSSKIQFCPSTQSERSFHSITGPD